MSQSKLSDFLRALSDNHDKLAAFEADPEHEMTESGLSDEEKDLVRSGDEERIMGYIDGLESAATAALPIRIPIRIRNIRIRFGV